MEEKINIIGAGIGGLTTALTLKQKGLNIRVFESSAEIKPVGAGIILANNAMQVFQKLGIQEKIEKAGNKISFMKITTPNSNHYQLSIYQNTSKSIMYQILPFTEATCKRYLPTNLVWKTYTFQNDFQKLKMENCLN